MRPPLTSPAMKNLFVVFAHILATIAKLLRPSGAKALVSENLLLKQQLLVINRSRLRAPNLTPLDRLFFRFLRYPSWSTAHCAISHHYQTIDDPGISQVAQETKIPATLLL